MVFTLEPEHHRGDLLHLQRGVELLGLGNGRAEVQLTRHEHGGCGDVSGVHQGRPAEVPELLGSLSADVRDHPRVRVLTARAALDTDDLDAVERILLSGVELSDLREGEVVLTELWFGMQEKRIAAAEGVEVDDALRERVRREFPPPPEIDFRMAEKASGAGQVGKAGKG